MSDQENFASFRTHAGAASILALLVLTGVMLLALLTRTPPPPPLDVAPFALAPFLGASLAVGAAAFFLSLRAASAAAAPALLFALTALVSFGPQKYFDPVFPGIWPTVVIAQIALVILLPWSLTAIWRSLHKD